MSTPNTIKAQLQSLIDTSNATTGKEDTDLTSAVGSLVDGYGAGGGSDNFYNDFWDSYQENGERADYSQAFNVLGWSDKNFYPKYDIHGTDFAECFRNASIEIDLSQRLKEQNISLDTSKAITLSSMFRLSKFTKIPTIDLTSASETATGASAPTYYLFGVCGKLHTIERVITKPSLTYSNTFTNCPLLANITFEGEIGKDISFKYSPSLTNESIQSIIDCLADLTGKTSQTVTFHEDIVAKIDANPAQLLAITDKNWTLA